MPALDKVDSLGLFGKKTDSCLVVLGCYSLLKWLQFSKGIGLQPGNKDGKCYMNVNIVLDLFLKYQQKKSQNPTKKHLSIHQPLNIKQGSN